MHLLNALIPFLFSRACVSAVPVMPSTAQLKLGSPLFLAGLVIANAKANCECEAERCVVPKLQGVQSYTLSSASPAQRSTRRRTAMIAIRIVAKLFVRAGWQAPAGVWDGVDPPSILSPHMAWLQLLGSLCAHEAIHLLVCHWPHVPCTLVSRVELEYNQGAGACQSAALDRLQEGSLGMQVSVLCDSVLCSKEEAAGGVVKDLPSCVGHFYYIAAGIGCGIAEIQQVRTAAH